VAVPGEEPPDVAGGVAGDGVEPVEPAGPVEGVELQAEAPAPETGEDISMEDVLRGTRKRAPQDDTVGQTF